MARKRRWLKITLYVILTIVVLVGAGIGYFLWKTYRNVYASAYDPSKLDSVTRYASQPPTGAKPVALSENPLFQYEFSLAGFANPETKYRPWVRWWWPGNAVRQDELRREVRLLKDHGFGGGEVQPFLIGVNTKAPAEAEKLYGFDTPSFYQNLGAVMDEALKQGLQIDLNVGSSWPPGGPQITQLDNIQTLAVGEKRVGGGKRVDVPLPAPRASLFYYILGALQTVARLDLGHFYQANATPIAVVAARISGGSRSWNPLSLSDQIQLDPASVTVLTSRVTAASRIVWDAPQGEWMLMAFYRMPSGERPMAGPAQRDPGFILDYFDSSRVLSDYNYLYGARTGLPQYFSRPLRALFNDSLELTVDRHITANFLDFFRQRRGYDATPHLPAQAVPGYDNFYLATFGLASRPKYKLSDDDDRLRYDYSLTVSDLFAEQFLDPTLQWGERNGLLTRTQAYGLKVDVIKAAGHVHIPETEALYGGGSEMSLRMVSSGAHLYNRPVVSAESFVHQGMDYMTTPQKLYIGANKLFVSGVNHIIYHGMPYRFGGPEYGETRWAPFSSPFLGMASFSSNASEADPFWADTSRVNDYIARCQYALRQGKPEAQVLVYYPFLGFPSELSTDASHREVFFNGIVAGVDKLHKSTGIAAMIGKGMSGASKPEVAWLRGVWPLLEELDRAGLGWEWINDESLQVAKLAGGSIDIRGNRYGAVLLADAKAIQTASADNLAKLSQDGARIWISGDAPGAQPGFLNHQENDARVASLMAGISQRAVRVSAKDAAEVFGRLSVPREIAYAARNESVQQITRRLPDGSLLMFLWNTADRDSSFELALNGRFSSYRWLDAADGSVYQASADAKGVLRGSLGPYRSTILFASRREAAAGGEMPLEKQTIDASRIAERWPLASWNLTVEGSDVPGGKVARQNAALFEWSGDAALKFVSSKGVYRARFTPAGLDANSSYLLDLGKVYFTAAVTVNGQPLPALLAAPYRADIGRFLKPGENSIEITVTPALRNRLLGKGDSGDKAYSQFKGKADTLLPAGLAGPVEVWRVKRSLPR